LVWFALVLAFITLSRSKLATYCLPLLPAMAVGCGWALARGLKRQRFRLLDALEYVLPAAWLLIITVGAVDGARSLSSPGAVASLCARGLVLFVIVGVLGIGCLVALGFKRIAAYIALVVTAMLVLQLGGSWLVVGHEDELWIGNEGRELAALIEARAASPAAGVEIRVAMFRRYLKELPYYLDEAVMCLDCDVELSYTRRDGEKVLLYTDEELHGLHDGYYRERGLMWLNRWLRRSDRRWFVVTDRDSFEQIRPMLVTSTGLPLVVEIAEVGELVLFSNFRDGETANVLAAAGRDAESGDGGDD